MTSTSFIKTKPKEARFQAIPFVIGVVVTILIGTMLFAFVNQLLISDKILPGIGVGGVDLSNLTQEEASIKLAQQITYPVTGKIILVDGTNSWMATPAQLGFYLDPQSSAQKAHQYGRGGFIFSRIINQFLSRSQQMNLAPVMVYDQKTAQDFLITIHNEITRPVVEANLELKGLEIIARPGQVGRELDIPGTLSLLDVQLQTQQDGVIPLIITETKPLVEDLSGQAESVRKILSEPMVLSMPAGQADGLGPWVIDQTTLSGMLTFTRNTQDPNNALIVGINADTLRNYLQGLSPVIDQLPENARFIFNDDTLQLDLLKNAVTGRSLDIEKTVQDVSTRLIQGEHQFGLVVNVAEPQVPDNATGASLGITQLVHKEVSYFYGSNGSRVNNIRTAAEKFHGLLIAPGQEVSMSDVIGDISLDNGFSEALIIFGNQTIKGVGGGVCQVSTTLFRAAFFAGFPITERHAHAYRVGYYEQTASGSTDSNLSGLDATVFVPVVDMKFTNDTPYWLLMETYPTETSLMWKFYSTADGRTIDWSTTGPVNIVKSPDDKYVENPDLPKGKIKQIDYSADGADINVTRTVYKDGQVYFQDDYQTHYVPWQAVFEYGPGTKLPKEARNN